MSSISILENAKFISICGGFHSDNLVWCHGNAGLMISSIQTIRMLAIVLLVMKGMEYMRLETYLQGGYTQIINTDIRFPDSGI